MSNQEFVDPEILRKARRIVEIYDLKPRVTGAFIRSKVFPINYSKDGWLYLDQSLLNRLEKNLIFFDNNINDIQGVEFFFDTNPFKKSIHSILFDDNNWRIISYTPKVQNSFHISLTGPIQFNNISNKIKKQTQINTFNYVENDKERFIIPASKTYEFNALSNSSDLRVKYPILFSSSINQKFKGISNAHIVINYIKFYLYYFFLKKS